MLPEGFFSMFDPYFIKYNVIKDYAYEYNIEKFPYELMEGPSLEDNIGFFQDNMDVIHSHVNFIRSNF